MYMDLKGNYVNDTTNKRSVILFVNVRFAKLRQMSQNEF